MTMLLSIIIVYIAAISKAPAEVPAEVAAEVAEERPPDFNCPIDPYGRCLDGEYADLNNCSTYYHCSNCIADQQFCPSGLHFHPVYELCDYPSSVNCRTGVRCDPLPIPQNGMKLVWHDEIYGGATLFGCNLGYRLYGDDIRICTSTGSWSGLQPICALMYCPALYPPENGAISQTGDVEYGGSVTFTCHPGYELVGSPIRRCITNETVEQVWWSGTHTTCEGEGITSPSTPIGSSTQQPISTTSGIATTKISSTHVSTSPSSTSKEPTTHGATNSTTMASTTPVTSAGTSKLTTPATGPSTSNAPTSPAIIVSTSKAPTTAETSPSTTNAQTTPPTSPSTSRAPTTPVTSPSTSRAPTTPVTSPGTSEAHTTSASTSESPSTPAISPSTSKGSTIPVTSPSTSKAPTAPPTSPSTTEATAAPTTSASTSREPTTNEPTTTANPFPSPGPDGYLGCYLDDEDCRIMKIFWYSNRMTVPACTEYCVHKSIANNGEYEHAGVQRGNECWCGRSSCPIERRDEAECSTRCSGDWSQTCGGDNRMSIYYFGMSQH